MHLTTITRLPVFRLGVLGFLCNLSIAFSSAFAQPSYDEPAWHEYAKGVFSFETESRNSIVLLGDSGVLIMDTYNSAHAQALKREIKQRFNLPVQYVVYSHAHADHLRGANIFSDTAMFIAQQRQLPRLEFLSQYEDSIVMPDTTFDKEYRIDFGGREVMLRDYGFNHATGITVMYLPQDKIVTAFDIIYPKRFLWYTLNDYSPRALLNTLRAVYEEDFDVSITAHGPPATRAEFKEFIGFMDDIITQVNEVIDRYGSEGPFVARERAFEEVDLTNYQDWGFYDEWRDDNIEGVFQSIFVGF